LPAPRAVGLEWGTLKASFSALFKVGPQMMENTSGALQAAEKLCFVSGHDFSRAING
jgi:hypothetical protein